MSRAKFLSLLVAGLLIANVSLTLFILLREPGGPPHRMPREIIIEKLHFTESQITAYDELIAWHRHEIHALDDQILQLKTRLYSDIPDKDKGAPNDTLLAELGGLQSRVEKIHYKHFRDIRQLCTPQQLPLFDELLKEIASLFSKPKRGPRP